GGYTPSIQGENPILGKDYVENSTANCGEGYENGDDSVTQAMLRVLHRVARAQTRSGNHGSVAERLQSNGVETFKAVVRTTPTMVEHWMELTKRILEDLDYTPKQKLKGTVSLLREMVYRWWKSTIRGTQADCINWEYFQEAFQKKYVGTRNHCRGARLVREVQKWVAIRPQNLEIFVDFYSLPSSPATHSLLEEPYLTLTKFSPQKHSNGSHFLLPSTLALLSFIQRQVNIFPSAVPFIFLSTIFSYP
ncbi:hypothetical protein Golax_014856, partial [Gossypium laxum]|nr:hypothetical protein [Gossypium laxum]